MATYRKLPSGKWQARVSRDGEEFSIGTFRTKKEAEIEAGKVEERIYYGQALNDRNMMFHEVASEWLSFKEGNLKASSYEYIEAVVRNHIIPRFGKKKIMRVQRADIKKWMKDYADEVKEDGNPKYSYDSRRKFLIVLKGILHYAVHDLEILEKNPADKLRVPLQDSVAEKKKVKYFTLDELNTLLNFMETYKHQRFEGYPLYYVLMFFLARTGLRISEALALKWSDISGNRLTVERQTRRDNNNKLFIISLKNSTSYRTIRIEDELIDVMMRFKQVQEDCIKSNAHFDKNPDDIIFQNYLGNYLTPSRIRALFKTYCSGAGVEYKGLHVFRHTHAVLLLESGASIMFVSRRLGHKNIKTTVDTYLAITEKIEEDELTKFSSYAKSDSESARNRHVDLEPPIEP